MTLEVSKVHFEVAGVHFAYLLGSRAQGRERDDSDTDVGVWYPEHLDVRERFLANCKLQERLDRELSTAVDLVILNDAKPSSNTRSFFWTADFWAGSVESRLLFESRIRGRSEDYAYGQRSFTQARQAQSI